MKKLYTHENWLLVGNMRNIVEAHGIKLIVKNEYSQGAIGEISAFDAWPELWVNNDTDYERALDIIEASVSKASDPEWLCSVCKEINDASFGVCWQCNNEPRNSA